MDAAYTAFDGWSRSHNTLDLYREHDHATYSKDGSFYSLKVVKGAGSAEKLKWLSDSPGNELTHRARYYGRTVTMGAWVYSVSAADNVKLAIFDGSWNYSDTYAAADGWVWLEMTQIIATDASAVHFAFTFDGDSADVAYISQPIAVFGNSIGEGNYTRPMNEVIFFELGQASNRFNNADVDDTTEVRVTSDSDGVVPKGVKAVYATLEGKAAANPGWALYTTIASGLGQHLQLRHAVNAVLTTNSGWVSIEPNGDFSIAEETPYTNVTLYYTGVMLR